MVWAGGAPHRLLGDSAMWWGRPRAAPIGAVVLWGMAVPRVSLAEEQFQVVGALMRDGAFDLCLDLVSDGAASLITSSRRAAGAVCASTISLRKKKIKLIKALLPGRVQGGERSVLSHTALESWSTVHIALGAPTHGRQFHAPSPVS